MKQFSQNGNLRLLPYPGGKTFAFTIIDDTDMETLETVRPIYDYLDSLGLKTTKTVWAVDAASPPVKASDAGDTLENQAYAAYMRELRNRGFEIALHNVSGQSSKRARIQVGLERYAKVLGERPRINVHHEKNRENLYFDFAQRGGHRPPPFRSAAFRGMYRLLRRDNSSAAPANHSCSGEDPGSEYFWGDMCRANIDYVRTNVFFPDLDTIKCNSLMPYRSAETPYVNHWFDSSNGQDAGCFNSILSDCNITALRNQHGCSILYTHFGKGFVQRKDGGFELNAETRRRLRAVAGHSKGWYAPVSEVLDRLLVFQRITLLPLPGGVVISNGNPHSIPSVMLQAEPGKTYCDLAGKAVAIADREGWVVLPSLAAGLTALVRTDRAGHSLAWHEQMRTSFASDLATVAQKFVARCQRYAQAH